MTQLLAQLGIGLTALTVVFLLLEVVLSAVRNVAL